MMRGGKGKENRGLNPSLGGGKGEACKKRRGKKSETD